ncbi:hypothetical protein NON00_06180 [Roseomonas sp. GC11]|uniref:hypothetical protein n=1 Tax=Roseomonas sp. GC11 TaxID=2950546 RepID=UPI00210D9B1B|nr:hypothetical protein [Roseomonas sp. GC11]MCQ4159512.1 hypothetical protein [Roseomonas sp. GC11]
MRPRLFIMPLLAGLALAGPALAEDPRPDCRTPPRDTRAEPATPPAPESRDGTAPGNAGSTGWTGGTGGSHIGTNPQGATPDSRTAHPPTARGLDPLAEPEKPIC